MTQTYNTLNMKQTQNHKTTVQVKFLFNIRSPDEGFQRGASRKQLSSKVYFAILFLNDKICPFCELW